MTHRLSTWCVDVDANYGSVWSKAKWQVWNLPGTTVWTKQYNLGPTEQGGLSPEQTEPLFVPCIIIGMFSERMKERGSKSTQTRKPCAWWRYKLGMSVEVCSPNYSVKSKRSNVSKPNHRSGLTGVKPQLNECISCCFSRLVKNPTHVS